MPVSQWSWLLWQCPVPLALVWLAVKAFQARLVRPQRCWWTLLGIVLMVASFSFAQLMILALSWFAAGRLTINMVSAMQIFSLASPMLSVTLTAGGWACLVRALFADRLDFGAPEELRP
jgi:hypothetical protein